MSSEDFEELDCVLCSQLLYEPVTIYCGHTFCRQCLTRCLDHTNQCPLCREVVHIDPQSAPVSIVLQNIIQKLLPEKFKERKAEIEQEIQATKQHLPLFGLSASCFPGQQFPMHIFEPRYRLMIRRVLQGSRSFGLVGSHKDPSSPQGYSLNSVGCCLQITQYQGLPDGRSIINTVGTKRFKILEKWDVDGYVVGRVEYLEDILPSQEYYEKTKESANLLKTKVSEFAQSCGLLAVVCPDLQQVVEEVHHIPPVGETVEEWNSFSYWVCKILPITSTLQQSLLEINSLSERLSTLHLLIQQGIANPLNCSLPPVPPAA